MSAGVETYFDGELWHSRAAGEEEPFYSSPARGRAVNAGHFEAQSRRVDHLVVEKDGTVGERHCYGDHHPAQTGPEPAVGISDSRRQSV